MQALSFSFENNAVRTLGTADLPLFVAIDVATALGYKNTKDAVLRHVDSDDLIKSEIADSSTESKPSTASTSLASTL